MHQLLRTAALVTLSSALLVGCPTEGSNDDDVADCTSAQRPTLTIVSPDTATYFDADEMISWSLTVTDPDTPPEDLSITLQDNSGSQGTELDVDVPVPNAQGQTTFTMPANLLEEGQAVVRVFVEDPEGCSTNDQILLCVDELIAPCE
ncbi:MAG: hypothetical protein KDA24_01120 [Deltaproteobacteria bacterium]|nr:hypothetical protein [Deltaproteobacteria bacterium]